ncbi:MAG TPA: phosphopyruvate hydratase, partial [Acidobacteriaceae bacterium]
MTELVNMISGASGKPIAVDRRPTLQDRLQHRIARSGKTRQQERSRNEMTEIVSIHAREILDSRGNPTVEADVIL